MKKLLFVFLLFGVSGCLDTGRSSGIEPIDTTNTPDLLAPDQDTATDVLGPDNGQTDASDDDEGPDTPVNPDAGASDTGPDPPPCDCDDGDPCTTDFCSEDGCINIPIADNYPCESDGDPCTWDICMDGSCVHTPRQGRDEPDTLSLNAVEVSQSGDLTFAGTAQQWSTDLWLSREHPTDGWTWSRTYEDWDQDEPSDMTLSPLGDIIVGGTTVKPETDEDMWLFSASPSNGLPQIDRDIGEVGLDLGNAVVNHPDGGYLVGGLAYNSSTIVKTDPQGVPLWLKSFDGAMGIEALLSTGDGFYAVATTDSFQLWLLRLDLKGNILWDKTYPSPLPRAITLTPDKDVVIVGTKKSLRKVTAGGETVWSTSLPVGGTLEELTSVVSDQDGNLYVGGNHYNSPYVAQLNEDGEVLWSWNGGGVGIVNDIALLESGVLAVGERAGEGFWVILDNGNECTEP